MDHEDLISELPQIEKLTNQERLRLAHKRRMIQLKKWAQHEKEHQSKKGRMLQNERKASKGRLAKTARSIRFKNNIMLLEAAGRNDVEEVKRLLEFGGVDPDASNEDGLTALHQCCIDDNEDMMNLLLDFGANVNAEDSEKWTPLHAAATCGHLHLVKCLIVKGANLLAVNAEGNMPYDICDEETTLDYIENEMSQRGVTQELIEEIRAAPETLMLNDMKAIQTQGGDLEYRDENGATPLHVAAGNGYIRVVEFLLDNHVATDLQDADQWQPVHAAACWSHIDVLEMLIMNGADLNARTKNNETPYAICEDPEVKVRIMELRSEQEVKQQDAAKRKIRRSQSSNSRTQSIRRTSHRDKSLTQKRDAADEALMLMAGRDISKDPSPSPTNGNILNSDQMFNPEENGSDDEQDNVISLSPAIFGKDSIAQIKMTQNEMERIKQIAVQSGALPSPTGNKQHLYTNAVVAKTNSLTMDSNANLPSIMPKAEISPPADSIVQKGINNGLLSGSSDSLAGSSTIDIHVSVTINTNSNSSSSTNGMMSSTTNTTNAMPYLPAISAFTTPPGTLADLKKQRSLQYLNRQNSLNSLPFNGLNDWPTTTVTKSYQPAPASPTVSLRRFAGDPGEIVGDYSEREKKCCSIV